MTKFSTDLGGIYTSLTTLLGDVKDAPPPTRPFPSSPTGPKLDGFKALWDKLPDTGKTTVAR